MNIQPSKAAADGQDQGLRDAIGDPIDGFESGSERRPALEEVEQERVFGERHKGRPHEHGFLIFSLKLNDPVDR